MGYAELLPVLCQLWHFLTSACFEKHADQMAFAEKKAILTNKLLMNSKGTLNVLNGIGSAWDVCLGKQNWQLRLCASVMVLFCPLLTIPTTPLNS